MAAPIVPVASILLPQSPRDDRCRRCGARDARTQANGGESQCADHRSPSRNFLQVHSHASFPNPLRVCNVSQPKFMPAVGDLVQTTTRPWITGAGSAPVSCWWGIRLASVIVAGTQAGPGERPAALYIPTHGGNTTTGSTDPRLVSRPDRSARLETVALLGRTGLAWLGRSAAEARPSSEQTAFREARDRKWSYLHRVVRPHAGGLSDRCSLASGPRVSAVCGFSGQRRGHDRQHRRRDRRKTEIAAGQPITSASLADSLASMFAAKCGNFRDTCAASRRFLRKPCGGRGRHAQRRGRRLGEYDGPDAHSDLPVQLCRAVRHPTARCRHPLHLAHRRSPTGQLWTPSWSTKFQLTSAMKLPAGRKPRAISTSHWM